MNQGMNTQTLSVAEPNSLESQYVVDASQGQTSYLSSATGSEPASWNIHGVDNRSTENGITFTASYSHDQQTQPASINVQDGLNTTALASSTVGTSVVPPDYSSYASYANAADPYSYANTGYPSYYSGYQQQPSHSYIQQQPSHSYPQKQQQQQASHSYPQQQQASHSYPQQQQASHSYPQEQPNHSYPQQQQPSHSYPQEQPNHSYPQQQPNHSYTPQQPNHSYSQPVGAYENTGAPYQPISSFQNTGSYAGTASYTTTYYNPGDYQTAGGYASSGYSNQPTSWTGGNYANYTSHQYSSYGPDTTSAYNSTAAPTSVNYEQQYKQWTDYYSQTEVSCAPGTEHLSVASASNQGSSVTGSYPASNSHLPSSFTPSWRPESTSSELPTQKPGVTTSGTHDVYWKQGGHNFQNNHASPSQPQFQSSLDSKTLHDNFQEQQKGAPQGLISQYPAAHQVAQSYQPLFHATPSVGTQRVSKLQIPTNPRIASNVHGLPKIERDSFAPSAPPKPAYVSVSMPKPKPNDIMHSHDAADYELKPGAFPKSLRSYVERAFELCKTDEQRMACQVAMKEVITKATADGTLHTRDWNAEPLFPLLNTDIADEESSQISTPISSLPKYKRSPSRRPKSRWEPLPQEKLVDKPVSVSNGAIKYGSWDRKFSPTQSSSGNYEGKEDAWSNIKFSLSEHKTLGKGAQRSVKRQRLADGFHAADNGDASSDSDKEQSLTPYYSSAMALATPEEKKKRESRSKRFDRGQGNRAEISYFKPKNVGAGNLYSRRASAVMLSKSFDDGGSRAVEDIDWDALTIKGTCQEIEKRYLRLTSAPDPSTVRPEEVLEKALLMVQNSQKNYLYKCDQLKSIRQDLTVQRIRNQLTVKVYETHARLAVEVGDLPEYNQCQSQLKTLYAEGIEGCHLEFAAYNLLCVILHSSNNRDLVSSMSRLTEEAKKDRAVKHALAVRAAVTSGNYVMFFRLYKEAPNLNTCLMDLCIEKVRYKAVSCMSRSYRPTVPVPYIAQVLGFSCSSEANDAKDSDGSGLEECVEWLKAHGACLIAENNGEMQFDAKASSSSLFMPEPEDAVAHGDTTLAVNDFLTRTS